MQKLRLALMSTLLVILCDHAGLASTAETILKAGVMQHSSVNYSDEFVFDIKTASAELAMPVISFNGTGLFDASRDTTRLYNAMDTDPSVLLGNLLDTEEVMHIRNATEVFTGLIEGIYSDILLSTPVPIVFLLMLSGVFGIFMTRKKVA